MMVFWLSIAVMTVFALSIVILPLLKSAKKQNSWVIPVLVLALPGIALSLYLKLGSSQTLEAQQHAREQRVTIDAEIQKLGSLHNIIHLLEEKVTANPDGRGYLLLGNLYLKSQQLQQASAAFAKANQLTPNQPEILVGYAQSLYLLNQQVLTQQASQLLQQALKSQPNQPDAINLLAMAAYQRGDYTHAIAYWEQLLALLQPGSEEQQKLLQMIAAVQKKAVSPRSSIRLHIDVSLAKQFQAKVAPDNTLFIYAKAVNGPPMPLAIMRKLAGELPLRVILDERMAMLPDATLADYKQVRVIAKISKSNQASVNIGDLEGISSVIDVSHPPANITLVINKQLTD